MNDIARGEAICWRLIFGFKVYCFFDQHPQMGAGCFGNIEGIHTVYKF